MTNFSDGVRIGNAGGLGDTRTLPIPFSGGGIQGADISPIKMYSIVPVTSLTNNIAAYAVVSGANWTLAAGTGVTSTSINGVTFYDLGVARCVQFTGSGASGVATLITLSGKDDYLQNMTQTLTGPTGTASVTTLKAFRYVAGAFSAGNTVSSVGIGASDTFGLPFCASSVDFVYMSWAGTKVTSSGSFVAGVTTSPSTALLGDVRGTYAVSSASDGVKRFTAHITVNDPNTVNGVIGVAQV